MTQIIYEDRAIAFIDILGFTELVRSKQVSKILNALRLVRANARRIENLPRAASVRISTFSDTIVLSVKRNDQEFPYLFYSVAALTAELFLRGIFCRGAITTGELHHRADILFGQALIDAYHIESKLAMYPRIVVTDSLAEHFVALRNKQLGQSRQRCLEDYFRRDFDDIYHLDVFSPWLFVPSRAGTIKQTVVKRIGQHIVAMMDVSESIEARRKMTKLFWVHEYMSYVDKVHGAWQIGRRGPRRGSARYAD